MAVVIKTDHKWKVLKYGSDLPVKQQKEFSHLTKAQYEDQRFIQYGRNYYDMQDFTAIKATVVGFRGWHGFLSESHWSGIIIKVNERNPTQYMVGRYTITEA